jgi:hypothetical protein
MTGRILVDFDREGNFKIMSTYVTASASAPKARTTLYETSYRCRSGRTLRIFCPSAPLAIQAHQAH